MATIVAGALVSEAVKLLLDKIVSGEFVDFFRSTKLDYSLFERLIPTLLSLQGVLNDAEKKQISDPAVKEWLVLLQDAVFDAEDLFDEINTEKLHCELKAEQKGKRAKLRKFLSPYFKSSYKTINSELEELHKKLNDLVGQVHLLKLKEGLSSIVWHSTPTSSVAEDESTIYGRKNDLEKLKNLLLFQDASEGGNKIEVSEGGNKIEVVFIVGMGGLGKTTLAKLLYNDSEVKQKFTLKAWAHISKDFDEVKVTKAILESITQKVPEANTSLNTLQVQLQESLNGKLFLLVLDDIWDVNYGVWNRLKNIFSVGEAGSKIIITTRDAGIPPAMQTSPSVHKLDPLESEHCWSLLAKHAFGASNNHQSSDLEGIGKEIAQKCGGLPLAAVALGGLLRTKLSQDDWNDVLKSNIWELGDAEVKPALLLSYYYLPGHLKRCFAYCAVFPKNYKLKKKIIVPLWIAEGLVLQPKSEKSWENFGEKYFDELVSRSLFQRRSVDGEEIFEMHDLMNELATTVSSPYFARLDEQKKVESLEKVRHLSYNRNGLNSYNKFDRLHGLKGLRTFLFLPLEERWLRDYCMSNKAVGDLLIAMKHLHSLSLSNCSLMTMVPTSIGNLIYLRYLNLSRTDIKNLPSETCKLVNLQTLIVSLCRSLFELPEDMGKLVSLRNLDVSHTPIVKLPSETCKLVNLQTLIVSHCSSLTELPEYMGKLVSLRNLDVSDTPLREMPVQIGKLKTLQTLSNFIVSKQCDGLKVGELGKLPHLKGNLSISELQNVIEPSDASQANLEMKKQMDKLILDWHYPAPSDSNPLIQSVVLERLQPTVNLKSLTIGGYGGTNFPNWLGDSSYGNMVYLKIKFCDNCSCLPPIGQLGNLKALFVEGMKLVKSVGAEFYGSGSGRPSFRPFPSLEALSFADMPKWEEWKEWNLIGGTTTTFPILRRLTLRRCPKLKGNIPTNLPSLILLELSECPLLVEPWSSDDNSNKTSSINDCENIKSLHNYTSLKYLRIENSCYSMTSFTLGSFPVLKTLTIEGCEKLKSIVIAEDASQQQSLSSLRDIFIWNCDELESFSFGGIGLGLSIPNLGDLRVGDCKKLHSLLEPMNTLVGLRKMFIYLDLPNMESIGKDGFPINLRELGISSIGGTLWNTIGWERLTCLSKLEIGRIWNAPDPTEEGFPLLPTSLVTLKIDDIGDIECLDGKWLHHLTSLQNLQILDARKLKSLPEEGFPSSLSKLWINYCPLLEAILQDKQGKEWSKIAHIPYIFINDTHM